MRSLKANELSPAYTVKLGSIYILEPAFPNKTVAVRTMLLRLARLSATQAKRTRRRQRCSESQ